MEQACTTPPMHGPARPCGLGLHVCRHAPLTLAKPPPILPPVIHRAAYVFALLICVAGCSTLSTGERQRPRGHVDYRGAPPAELPAAIAGNVVLTALNFVDTPYRYGGNTAATGFDCSGFTRHVYRQALGVTLPRRSAAQARTDDMRAVDVRDLMPGDLVFFNTLSSAYSHVGIYIGDERFVHAPRTGAQVRVEDMRTSYWARRYDGARRAVAEDSARAATAR